MKDPYNEPDGAWETLIRMAGMWDTHGTVLEPEGPSDDDLALWALPGTNVMREQ
jgi:hypothetical protein